MDNSRQALQAELGHVVQHYQRSVQAFDDAAGRRLGVGPADLRCLDWLTDGPMSAGKLSAATGLKVGATYQPLVEEGQGTFDGLTVHDLTVMRDYLEACTALTDRHRGRVNGD